MNGFGAFAAGRPAVFLDRDGTINVRARAHEYIRDPAEFKWLPDALDGMVALARAGLPLVVVSNQRGVSRGLVSRDGLRAIEAVIQSALSEYGCWVEAFRYCTHGLEEGCDCRKPRPGLLLGGARDMGIDLRHSWMIGDGEEDVYAGRAAGCRVIRVGSDPSSGVISAPSLREAARLVLDQRFVAM